MNRELIDVLLDHIKEGDVFSASARHHLIHQGPDVLQARIQDVEVWEIGRVTTKNYHLTMGEWISLKGEVPEGVFRRREIARLEKRIRDDREELIRLKES